MKERQGLYELYDRFSENHLTQKQAVFASIFVIQNRIQTSYEKVQDELTMKQWLLLLMVSVTPEPHTLTNISSYLGCSRQNAKQLAASLSKKGYLRLVPGAQNSVHLEITEKAISNESKMEEKNEEAMKLLFSEFNEKEILQFYKLFKKLYLGVERFESHMEKRANK
jgi:DNA-binding MarR family transcriptional regulator